MIENMMTVYQMARNKFDDKDFLDCSNLKYTMADATKEKW